MNILCGVVVVGRGDCTMFLICPAMNLLVDKNSVKYSVRTKIVPQEGYGTRVLTSNACGMCRHLRCSRCTAFFEQSIPVWSRLYEGILTSDACGMQPHLRCSRCTPFFEQSIPVWNRLYEGILTSDACGIRRHLHCSRCTAFFEQIIPFWYRLYKGTK